MNKYWNKKNYISVGLIIGILIYIIFICGTNLFHFNYQMNSDIASDVILGELIWKSREVVPSTWYVAAETRIICTPNLAALFFGMTKDMVLASGLACCTMSVMIILSIVYFGRSAGMKINNAMLMGLLCMAFPCNLIILELLYLFASYYAIHVVFLFITLALYVRAMRLREIKWPQFFVAIIMALLLGLQGVRGILIIYGPMFGIEMIRNIYLFYCRQKRERVDLLLSLWVIVLLIGSFIGTCFPSAIGQSFSRNIRKGFHKLLTVVIPDIVRASGWESTNKIGKLCLGILLLISLYILVGILWRMLKREAIKPMEWGWLVIFSLPIVSALMVSFTTVGSSERYFFMLPFVMAFSVGLLLEQNGAGRKIIGVTTAIVLVVLNSFSVYSPIFRSKEPPDSNRYEVVRFLEEEGYMVAYSTFESANMMTILSNGRVRVYPVASVENMDICKWMASTEWYCPNVPFKQKTAYIISASEMDGFQNFLAEKGEFVHKLKEIGIYTIYVSDNNYSNLG